MENKTEAAAVAVAVAAAVATEAIHWGGEVLSV